jgi:tetratricopeptide (TPR) repeat protein
MLTTALVVSLIVAAPPAKPPPPPPAAEDADVKKARELFQWAQKLYKQARYAEAIAKFEEAYTVRPHPVIIFNIGKCHEQLGDTPKALRAYRDYLRLSPDASDRETVTDAIANLERRLKERGVQQLMVFAEPPNARIEVDGKYLGTSPATVELQAGNHQLTVSAEGYEKVDRSFVMSTTRSMEMTINLRPTKPEPTTPPVADAPKKEEPKVAALTPPPPPEPPLEVAKPAPEPAKKGRLFTWIAGGTAVAAAGAAVGLGAAAVGEAERYRALDPNTTDFATRQAAYNSATGLQTGTNVLWVTAATAAAAAVVLFFVEGN